MKNPDRLTYRGKILRGKVNFGQPCTDNFTRHHNLFVIKLRLIRFLYLFGRFSSGYAFFPLWSGLIILMGAISWVSLWPRLITISEAPPVNLFYTLSWCLGEDALTILSALKQKQLCSEAVLIPLLPHLTSN